MKKERGVIAVCASWEDEENLNMVLTSLIHEARDWDYLPVCITFDRSIVVARGDDGLREFMSLFEIRNLSGVILMGEMIREDHINRTIIRMAQTKGIPVFMLERIYEGCINLKYEYRSGFEQIVRHMVDYHHCRDIVMVAGIRGNAYSEERIEVCRNVMKEYGRELTDSRIIYGDFWEGPTKRALRRYFARGGKMPEAFICVNDAMAVAVCNYLNELGVAVPEQVKISGFDGIMQSERHLPNITTAKPDFETVMKDVFRRIDSWGQKDVGKTEYWPLPFLIERRQSCGCQQQDYVSASSIISVMTVENQDYAHHIREMGHFIRKTMRVDDMDELVRILPEAVVEWPEQYYCICILDKDDSRYAQTILHGSEGSYTSGHRFPWRGAPIPDFEAVVEDRSISIVLAHLLQTTDETMGYIVSGFHHFGLREEQRFEEQAVFMSSVLSSVFNNRRLNQANTAIRELAEHDFLTGLYNRRGFQQALDNLTRIPELQDRYLVLVSIDLDYLKMMNDQFGHAEGDFAIQCIARALQQEVEDAGHGACARYGGDEFALAVFMESKPDSIEPFRMRIEKTARHLAGEKPYLISASMGACTQRVRERSTLESMMASADQALYEDKKQRRTNRQ